MFYTSQNTVFLMQTLLTWEVLIGLLLSLGFGAIVGFEREQARRPAGLRTHMLVCLGTCLFTIVSYSFASDPARIAAGVVAGIGFIGAGTIWSEKDKVKGITTAASLWVTAAIGLSTGIGDYPLAGLVTLLTVVVLASERILTKKGIETSQ